MYRYSNLIKQRFQKFLISINNSKYVITLYSIILCKNLCHSVENFIDIKILKNFIDIVLLLHKSLLIIALLTNY